MKKLMVLFFVLLLLAGCASNVHFKKTDSSYKCESKPDDTNIIFTTEKLKRPHKVIGVISAELGKNARNEELDMLMIDKAREIGADAIMLVEYDIDKDIYVDTHHGTAGRGVRRHHVVKTTKHVEVKKTASGIAVIFIEDDGGKSDVPSSQIDE